MQAAPQIPPPENLERMSTQFTNAIKSQLSYLNEDPKRVGKRINGRLYYLIIGTLLFGYNAVRKFVKWDLTGWTVQDEIVSTFASFNIYWESNDENGNAIFDDALSGYDKMMKVEAICELVAFLAFIIALYMI